MKITKDHIGHTITLQLEKDEERDFDSIYNSDGLFLNDLYLKLDNDCCLWLIDYNQQNARLLTQYMFTSAMWEEYDFFSKLLSCEPFTIEMNCTLHEIQEYFHEDTL